MHTKNIKNMFLFFFVSVNREWFRKKEEIPVGIKIIKQTEWATFTVWAM